MKNIKPGDIALFQDKSGATRQALILSVGNECICTLLHDFRSSGMVEVGSRFTDPTDLMKKSADVFITTTMPISADALHIVRVAVAKAIGMDISQSGLSADLRRALEAKKSLEEQVAKLTVYKALYEQFLQSICESLSQNASATVEPLKEESPPKLTHAEKERIARLERRKKYAPLQAYIDVKLKGMRMSRNQLDALLGYANGTVSHWILGDALARWDELAQIPAMANIRAEPEAWLKEQTGHQERNDT